MSAQISRASRRFEAPDDLGLGFALGQAASDVVAGGLVVLHPHDHGAVQGSVGVAVAAAIEAVAGGGPAGGRQG